METNFELNKITKQIINEGYNDSKSFVLNFSNGLDEKKITLVGSGDLKETAKV